MTPLSQITPGGPFEGVYAVRRVERRLARSGRPFLSVELGDASGTARAVVFEQPDWFRERLVEGEAAHVAGRASERGGRLELVISQVRPAEDTPTDTLVARSHRDPDELFGFVLGLADEVYDPVLRRLLDALTGDAALAQAWRTVPCTRSGHHAYAGGLVEHTVGVAALCQTLCTWHPRLDSDLLVTAALVHDLGYTRAWTVGATVEATPAGTMLGHVALGVDLVGEACRRVGVPDDRMLALLHCVAWHHGPPPGQGHGGASPEAVALARANDLEVRVKSRLEGGGVDGPAL